MELKARLDSLLWNRKEKEAKIVFASDSIPEELETMEGDLLITVKKYRKKRSKDANAFLWACIGELANALRADKWEIYRRLLKRYGQFEVFETRTAAFGKLAEEFRLVEDLGETRLGFSQYLCYWGTHLYDTAEFSILLDGVVQEMKDAGLTPPPSTEMKRALEEWDEKHRTG